ncbi:MAG: copper resistance protein B [Acidobacteriota bacterium]
MSARLIVAAALLVTASGSGVAFAQQPQPPAAPVHVHDHGAQSTPAAPLPPTAHDHSPHAGHETAAAATLPPHVPPLTDADRAAAFPDVDGHRVHDAAINWFVLFDQFEWQAGSSDSGASWDTRGWVGGDRSRIWFRTEGDFGDERIEQAKVLVTYGRAMSRWWDVLVGVEQDLRPGPIRTWAAVGIQGLAPQWFEVEATAYIGPSGRTHFRFETEYELLLTNRLVLQPLVELEVFGKADPARGVGRGLSYADMGLRLRYEIRREFAPYVGVVWEKKFFGTADLARAEGHGTGGARLALGVRFWM